MSWHFSRALVAEYSAACCADSELFAELKSSDTPETYCWQDKTTESLSLFQYGMMSEPLMADLGEELLMWFRGDSRARISPLRGLCGVDWGWKETAQVYGGRTCELLRRFSQPTYSVKTRQRCGRLDLSKSSLDLPTSGITAGGLLWEVTLSDLIARDGDCGSTLPAPTARDWKDTFGMNTVRKDGKTRLDRLPMLLFEAVRNAGMCLTSPAASTGAQTVTLRGVVSVTIRGTDYCPELPEWLMGWPIGWTDLKRLETDRFQQWLHLHGIC